MLKVEGRMELAVLRKHGVSIRELARVTGHSRNTVRRYLRGDKATERRTPTAKRAEKLDDFKDYIVARMGAASPARVPAAVLFREIKQRGYQGGETRVKQFVRTLIRSFRRLSLNRSSGLRRSLGSRCRRTGRRSAVGWTVCRCHCDTRLEPHGLCRVLR
jgi:transcriptional regulator with XRE-family HTH domain